MKISRIIIAICVVVLIFGGVAVSKYLGLWEVTSSKVPSKIENGEFAGESDPWDIRGSYTLDDIQKAFDVEPELIARAFGIAGDDVASVQVKALEAMYEERNYPVEIGTSSVRLFVALYKGLPIEDETGITKQALNILKEQDKINQKQYDTLIVSAIDISDETADYTQIQGTENASEEEHRSSNEVTGSTTIEQALAMGIDQDFLEKQIGDISNRDKSETIRDISKAEGLSFGEIKTILNDSISK